MPIFRLIRDTDDGSTLIDNIDCAVVEATDAANALVVALALDSRLPPDYWTAATVVNEDLEAAPYLGGLFKVVSDKGF